MGGRNQGGSSVTPQMPDVLSVILGGGRGTRLYPLTKFRSEPAVPIAGKYRLIDIPVSNCINSGIARIYVVTQFLSVSLHRHISNTYEFDPFSQCFVEVLAAQQTNETADWFQGTADAIRQNLTFIRSESAQDILILSGDQIYRMDFRELLKTHRENSADVTIAVTPVRREQAPRFGIVRLNDRRQIAELVEKPQTDTQVAELRTPPEWFEQQGMAPNNREYLANMGIYLFKREVLFDLLRDQPLARDMVTEIFPRRISTNPIQAHVFDGYWADVGSVKSYFEASLALTADQPPFNFHTPEGVIFTRMRNLPASRVEAASAAQCLISDGCTVSPGSRLERCIVGLRSHIGKNVSLRDAIVIGADRFETPAERDANRRKNVPDIGIGDDAVIERAILDKDCRIGTKVRIVNAGRVQEAEGPNYVIRDGIVVIPNDTTVADGTVI